MPENSPEPGGKPPRRRIPRQPQRPKELMDLDKVVGEAHIPGEDRPRPDRRRSLADLSGDRRSIEKSRGGIAAAEASPAAVRRRKWVRYGTIGAVGLGLLLLAALIGAAAPGDASAAKVVQAREELAALRQAVQALELPPMPRRRKLKMTRAEQITRALRAFGESPSDRVPANFPAELRDPWDRLYEITVKAEDEFRDPTVEVELTSRGPLPFEAADDLTESFELDFPRQQHRP